MKKLLILLAITTAAAMTHTSCTQKDKADQATSTNPPQTTESDSAPAAQAVESDGLIMTPNGIGVIVKGMNISKLPPSAEGLYDRLEVKSEENEMDGITEKSVIFYIQNKEAIEAWVDEADCIGGVTVKNKKFKTAGGIYPHAPVKHLVGKNVRWTYYNDGTLYAEDDDFYYNLSSEGLSAEGQARVETAKDFGKISDFKPTTLVLSISTRNEEP